MYLTISYDIANDRRRTRVAHLLEDYGKRVQYSVFDCILDERDLQRLRKKLDRVVDHEADSVRFYRLCRRCAGAIDILGKGTVIEDDDFRIL